ncbi:hypothetical protein [Aporhodopirellula aestuarii]|uniref:Uncharacterized protein n=1 Tax=Aporhodopirellula aestuarii TaxID=2950107 RepID=A0ABT0U264_9BACT|nr:hypothetical protein [Aporhodopirellula aestuarii]MCM2370938.1 hypothetical protein [Aporhodopirellula aestuarii]
MTRRDRCHREQATLFALMESAPTHPIAPPRSGQLVRATDPATSEAAAERLVRSGAHRSNLLDALALVRQNPGRTAYELDAIDEANSGNVRDKTDRRISRRLSELADKAAPEIFRGKKRDCHEKGSPCATWWPIEMYDQITRNSQ